MSSKFAPEGGELHGGILQRTVREQERHRQYQSGVGFSTWSMTITSTGPRAAFRRRPSCSRIAVKMDAPSDVGARGSFVPAGRPAVVGPPSSPASGVHSKVKSKRPARSVLSSTGRATAYESWLAKVADV